MARFNAELPNDIIRDVQRLEHNTHEMLAEMTQAGAQVVEDNIKQNVPQSWHSSSIMNCLKVTDPYVTPSDDGVNSKVAFYGYFVNEQGRRTPAPLVANVTEYGRSNSPYPKHPFMRRSFKKSDIERAMLRVQERYIGD